MVIVPCQLYQSVVKYIVHNTALMVDGVLRKPEDGRHAGDGLAPIKHPFTAVIVFKVPIRPHDVTLPDPRKKGSVGAHSYPKRRLCKYVVECWIQINS